MSIKQFQLAKQRMGYGLYRPESRACKEELSPQGGKSRYWENNIKVQAHTNGVESFWSMLKRGHMGVYHKMSKKHLQRYIDE